MAVIDTVKAWKKLKGEDEEEKKVDGAGEAEHKEGEEVKEDEESEEDKEDAKWTEYEVKQLSERTDYVTLLLDHERHVSEGLGGDKAKSLREFSILSPLSY